MKHFWLLCFVIGFSFSLFSQEGNDRSQRASIRTLQQQTILHFQKVIEDLQETSALLRESDPESAQRLDRALEYLRGINVLEKMDLALEYLQSKGKKYSAGKVQEEIIGHLEEILTILTLSQGEQDRKTVEKAIQEIKQMEMLQQNLSKKETAEALAHQEDLLERLSQLKSELSQIQENSPLGGAALESLKALNEAEINMKEHLQSLSDSSSTSQEGSQEAEKELAKARQALEAGLSEASEAAESPLDQIKKEIGRILAVQKEQDRQLTKLKQSIEKKGTLGRADRKKIKNHLNVFHQQVIDMEKVQARFEVEEASSFAYLMGTAVDDETALLEELKQKRVGVLALLQSEAVIQTLEDLLEALEDLEPLKEEGDGGGGGEGEGKGGEGEQALVADYKKLVLLRRLQDRNLQKTRQLGNADNEVPEVMDHLKNQQGKIYGLYREIIKDLEGPAGF